MANKAFTRTKSFSSKTTGKNKEGIFTQSEEQGDWAPGCGPKESWKQIPPPAGDFSRHICIDCLIALQRSREDRGQRTSVVDSEVTRCTATIVSENLAMYFTLLELEINLRIRLL